MVSQWEDADSVTHRLCGFRLDCKTSRPACDVRVAPKHLAYGRQTDCKRNYVKKKGTQRFASTPLRAGPHTTSIYSLPSYTSPAARADAGGVAAGQWKGKSVQVVKSASEAQLNAMEELSRDAAIRLRERRGVDGASEWPDVDILSIEKIRTYLDAAHQGHDTEALARLARRMLQAPERAAALAREAGGGHDPVLGHLALQRALADSREDVDNSATLALLEDALVDVEITHGPAVRAALNTIHTAAEGAQTSSEVKSFQAAYRDIVLGLPTLGEALTTILREFGEVRFAEGLQRMIRALGQDLNAARPSSSPVRLNQLVQDLYHLQVVSTVLEGCNTLCAELGTRFGTQGVSSQNLRERLIALGSERWSTGQRMISLAESCEIRAIVAQIFFLTWTRRLLKRMPLKVFFDEDCRQSVLNASQEALDVVIAREEDGDGNDPDDPDCDDDDDANADDTNGTNGTPSPPAGH